MQVGTRPRREDTARFRGAGADANVSGQQRVGAEPADYASRGAPRPLPGPRNALRRAGRWAVWQCFAR